MTDKTYLSPDYRAILRALPKDEKRRMIKLTNYHALFWLAAHMGFIAIMTWLNATYTTALGWFGLLGQGIAMCFLFCAMHEASHGTAFKSKALNAAVTTSVGAVLFLGPMWFRSFHSAHHRHTHDPQLDPELTIPKPQTWGQYLFHLSGIMIWISALKTLMVNAVQLAQDTFIPVTARPLVMTEARLMLMGYVIIIGGGVMLAPQLIWQYWLLPLLLGQPFLRLFLMAEHAGCSHDPDMLKNSRTTRTHPIVLFLSWNMPYHTAHHSFPAVPFHQLPSFHRHIADHVKVTADSYHGFHHGYAKNLRHS